MKLKDKKINFLGDSITEGAGASNHNNCFISLVAQQTGAICRNYGIGGTRIAKQHNPSEIPTYDLDFCTRVSEMDEDADIIIIFGGTNDYGHGDAPLGCMDDCTPYSFYGALHTLYSSILEKFPTSTIVVLTPLHRVGENNPCSGSKKEQDGIVLKDYVEIIREVAEYYSFPILDLYKNSGLQPNVPIIKEKYFVDAVHPNDDGHSILAKKIIGFLELIL